VQFDREGKATNIEIAIAGYKMILNVFGRKTFSEEWAKTQHSRLASLKLWVKFFWITTLIRV
jgi:hypothetical protein